MKSLVGERRPVEGAVPMRRAPTNLIQRKCACGGPSGVTSECEGCRSGKLARQHGGSSASRPSAVPHIVHEVLRSPGHPLDQDTRAFMEPRFGHDFGRVRVHTNYRAAESARAVNALAYTVGRDVVFGAGQYAPEDPAGRLLLAHELTHVVQQRGNEQMPPVELSQPADAEEQEAASLSTSILADPVRGNRVTVNADSKPGTVHGGWPLIVGGVALIGGGIYAIWAYRCLSPLEIPMYNATFGDVSTRAGGFRLWYYNQTHAPVPSNVWDAFGHCWIACSATERCGSITSAIAGKSREFWREHIDSSPHDSYQQDTNNQTLGRGFGKGGADCTVSCRNAALPGGAMDLSAPQAGFWTPVLGDYTAPPPAPSAVSPPPDASVPSDAGVSPPDAGAPSDAGASLPGGLP
jgi:hypothetical protein